MTRWTVLCLSLLTIASRIYAETETDRLTTCMISKTTPDEIKTMNRWAYIAMGMSRDVHDLNAATDAEANATSQRINNLYTDLLTHRCVNEARQAMIHDGRHATGAGFQKLGSFAINNLVTDPFFDAYVRAPLSQENIKQLQDTFKDISQSQQTPTNTAPSDAK